jgi:hypothetical protein
MSLRGLTAVLMSISALAFGPVVAHAADVNATTSNFSSVYSSAQGGDTIHLAAGDYGTWSPSSSKSSVVTITPQPGARVQIYPSIYVSNIKFDGLVIDGAYLNGAKNVSIVNSTVTSMMRVDTPTSAPNANILIDHNTFSNINVCSTCYEGRLAIRGYNNTQPVGVTVSNNLFGPGGDSDGVQIIGDAYGVQIGPGNEFRGLAQVSEAHTDALQLYGSSHTLITGNWMHDNSTGIMAPDGSDHEIITNNVIETTGYPWPIVMGAATGNTITHNVLPGSGGTIELDKSNGGAASTGNVIKDNVIARITSAAGGVPQGATMDYNLVSGSKIGAHDIKASPTYSGGSAPSAYAGYALSASSAGATNASDGLAMGITTGSGGAPPPPPPADTTAPDTMISSGPSGTSTTDTTPTFAFTSSESGSFECKVDSTSWASCTSPKTLATLAAGSHTFSVRATDAAGNTDATAASATFTVTVTPAADTTPPDTTITSGPADVTNDPMPTFAFTATESGSTFQCRIDLGTWAACTSPKMLSTLASGNHSFAVRAKDAAGNTDASPSARSFLVDTTAPKTTITSGPSLLDVSSLATVAFTSDDAKARQECKLDAGDWTACTSPYSVAGLGIGQHTVLVRSIDTVGNVESPAAGTTWAVLLPSLPPPPTTTPPTTTPHPSDPATPPTRDTPSDAAPSVALVRPIAGARFTRTLTLAATAVDDQAIDRVEFWVDGKRVASDATAPYKVTDWPAPSTMPYGTHTVVARAFDRGGRAASAAVNVVRVRKGSSAHAAMSSTWRVSSAEAAAGTAINGAGPARDAAKVSVARCRDPQGATVSSLTLRAGRHGTLVSSLADTGLCVLLIRGVG